MENLLLQLLPARPPSMLVRYGITTLLVLGTAVVRMTLEESLRGYPFLLFFPAIFLASLLFDRGSGFLATAEATLLAAWIWFEPLAETGPARGEPTRYFPAILFFAIGCGIAALTEALRRAMERAAEAERQKDLLLRELEHRARNDLQTVAALLQLGRRSGQGVEQVIPPALDRIAVLSRVYARLHLRDGQAAVDAKEFLEGLVGDLAGAHLGLRPVVVTARADGIEIGQRLASALGLLVNELVTNAIKYAFPDGRAGEIRVDLRAEGDALVLSVEDDGVGCAPPAPRPPPKGTGLGRLLVQQLVAQNRGAVEWTPGGVPEAGAATGGTRVVVRLPCEPG